MMSFIVIITADLVINAWIAVKMMMTSHPRETKQSKITVSPGKEVITEVR